MAYDNRDSIDFGKEKITHLFNSLFFPTLLGMIFNVSFVLADGIFVGHGVGANGLAAVNLASPVMMLITGIAMMFGIGASVVAAIHLAKDNVKAARINVTQAFEASLLLSLVVTAVMYTCPRPVMRLLGTSEELMLYVLDYILWFIPTCILIMIQIVGEFVIRLDGSPRYAMVANIVPAVLNIGLDWLFIFPLGMGLKGAALATTIGTGIGASMTLYYVFKLSHSLKIYRLKRTLTSFRLGLRNVGYMMRVGFSGFLGELASSVMALAGNLAFGKYTGDAGIAAFSVICYLTPVLFNVFYAVSSSAQPIISFNYGAGSQSRVKRTFRLSLLICTGFAAVVAVLAVLFSPTVISVFLPKGSEAYELASKGLPLFAAGFIFMGLNISSIGYYQSVEKSFAATVLVSLRGIILLIAAFVSLPEMFGVSGLWLAVPTAEIITSICVPFPVLFSYFTRATRVKYENQ